MNCDNIKELSFAYFKDEIDVEQRQKIESHLHSCRSCSNFYLFTKMNFAKIEEARLKENDPYFYPALMAKIENQNTSSTLISRNPVLRLSLVSLILLISIFSGLFIGNYSAELYNSSTNITEPTSEQQLGLDLANNEIDIFNDLYINDDE